MPRWGQATRHYLNPSSTRARRFPLPHGPGQVKLPVGQVDLDRFFFFISYKQIEEFQNSWSWASDDFEKRRALSTHNFLTPCWIFEFGSVIDVQKTIYIYIFFYKFLALILYVHKCYSFQFWVLILNTDHCSMKKPMNNDSYAFRRTKWSHLIVMLGEQKFFLNTLRHGI